MALREFFCRRCLQSVATSDDIAPEGWYSLTRVWRAHHNGRVRIGLLCSPECAREFFENEQNRGY